MPNGKSQVAQYIYLAQLHAAKGSCKCQVCQLMRKTVDAMTEEILNPSKTNPVGIQEALEVLKAGGIDISSLMIPEVTD